MKSASIAAGYLLALVSGSALSGAATDIVPISVGFEHGCTSIFPEKLLCWGINQFNQVGAGPVGLGFVAPTPVLEMFGLSDYSAGQSTSCALKDGQVFCWGDNLPGESYQFQSGVTPIAAYPPGSGVTDVEVNVESCVVRNGGVECWETSMENPDPVPSAVNGLPQTVTQLSLGLDYYVDGVSRHHACAVAGGKGYCWGTNAAGELGSGDNLDKTAAVEVVNLGSGVTAIASGLVHSCAVVNGGVKCWGDNKYGQLGITAPPTTTAAVAVDVLSDGVSAIAAGAFHTCAIQYGTVYCWGANGSQQIGDGTTQNRFSPTPAAIFPYAATAIDAGFSVTCATNHAEFKKPGVVACWGADVQSFNFIAFPNVWSSGFETPGGSYSN